MNELRSPGLATSPSNPLTVMGEKPGVAHPLTGEVAAGRVARPIWSQEPALTAQCERWRSGATLLPSNRESAAWDKSVLAFNPFDADRDSGARVLRDRIVTALRSGTCCICFGPISAGTHTRARVEVCDDQIMTFRFCEPCCDAMAASWTDHGEAITQRTAMGMEAAQ